MYFTFVNPLSRTLLYFFLPGFSSVFIKLGCGVCFFKSVGCKEMLDLVLLLDSVLVFHSTKQSQGSFYTFTDSLKSDHSSFAVYKASLDCRAGWRPSLDWNNVFCRYFRTEVLFFFPSKTSGGRRSTLSWAHTSSAYVWIAIAYVTA